jgi:hypothetical protein
VRIASRTTLLAPGGMVKVPPFSYCDKSRPPVGVPEGDGTGVGVDELGDEIAVEIGDGTTSELTTSDGPLDFLASIPIATEIPIRINVTIAMPENAFPVAKAEGIRDMGEISLLILSSADQIVNRLGSNSLGITARDRRFREIYSQFRVVVNSYPNNRNKKI